MVYVSPRCRFIKSEARAVMKARLQNEDSSGLDITYREDGFVTMANRFKGQEYHCRRLDPEAHQQVMTILGDPHEALDRRVRFQDARRGPRMVYVVMDDRRSPRTVAWWSPGFPARAGHVEVLDDAFCTLERRLPALRRYVREHAADFLAVRGRESPCGESPSA